MTTPDEAAQAVDDKKGNESEMPPNEAEASKATPEPTATETAPLATPDDVKVKFISGADAKLEMGDGPKATDATDKDEFTAMSKSELMKYAKDPFWIGLRWGLFILFWAAWLAMLIAAVVIIVFAPKCPPPAPKSYWQKAPIYECYTKSFKDSDGDGIGDLKGVESKLDYLQELGVGSVRLSPFFKSPMKDNGYDIQDFIAVDPSFGSIQDFKSLLAGMHERNIKMIIDFVPNHSSDQHDWFQKSAKKEEPFSDFYVWADGKNDGPPNNWKSVFGGSAWTFNEERGQYYLHQFYEAQPDLNLRNEKVKKEMINVLKFWLDLGVDGFRVDGVAHFFEDPELKDEPAVGSGSGYDSVEHKYTFDLKENLELLQEFRKVLDEATAKDEYNPRIMMTEAYLTVEDMGKYYGDVDEQVGAISHIPLNFGLITNFATEDDATADEVYNTITSYLNGLPKEAVKSEKENVVATGDALIKAWSNFNTGNHDNSRMASRFGSTLMDGMNMIVMLLQGTPIVYYGDEIGMVDGQDASQNDQHQRDIYRTPMQWNSDANAGFTEGNPWLPVNANYKDINVASEEGDTPSHLNVFKKLVAFRHHDNVLYGDTEFKLNGTVFGFTRIKKGNPGVMVAVNFGDEEAIFDASSFVRVPDKGTPNLRSSAFDEGEEELSVTMKEVKLQPKEGRVITFIPDFSS